MSHDMQMARDTKPGEINLAVGEPYFFRRSVLPAITVRHIDKELAYPQVGGEPELLAELHRLMPQYPFIVVTNGAKQAISAAFYAFSELEKKFSVWHQVPYWPSYPTLAKGLGLDFNEPGWRGNQIVCVTSPGNPDGSQDYPPFDAPVEVWDAAYAQPLYGFRGVPPPHRVGIFSAAKMWGLSGLRIGWAGTYERSLYELMSYYVEITTSGVAVSSQMYLAGILRAIREPEQIGPVTDATLEARAALMTNGTLFLEILGNLVEQVKGVPADGSGMFAWFRARQPEAFRRALKDAKVKVVTGEACGEKQDGWFRMSMGHLPEVTREALERIQYAYLG
jgi:aspartate/methionine/tyrosine aminotransferase